MPLAGLFSSNQIVLALISDGQKVSSKKCLKEFELSKNMSQRCLPWLVSFLYLCQVSNPGFLQWPLL